MSTTLTTAARTAGDIRLDETDEQGMDLLAHHVPLTLLLDLAPAGGPVSTELYEAEPADVEWVPSPRSGA